MYGGLALHEDMHMATVHILLSEQTGPRLQLSLSLSHC
jgi:hypothetical protein